MKLEMGESLFYSWLRHIKGCQLVQTNWKASPNWVLYNESTLEELKECASQRFHEELGLNVFGKTKTLKQFLRQAECDVLGIVAGQGRNDLFAVDVAFHTGGLLYHNRNGTVAKVLEKCVRNAMCVYGYYNTSDAEIIFASPKVSDTIMKQLNLAVEVLQLLSAEMGLHFRFKVLANAEFKKEVLDCVLSLNDEVADTTELFLRSSQLITLLQNSKETK